MSDNEKDEQHGRLGRLFAALVGTDADEIAPHDETPTDLFNNAALAEACVEMQIVTGETLTDVVKLVGQLPESQREVVYLRFYRDMSFKEIADYTGVSINTALGRMRYALLNMRRMAGEHHLL